MAEPSKTDWNKVGALAGLGALAVAMATLGIMLWQIWVPRPQFTERFDSAVIAWWPPILIGSCVLLAGAFHLIASFVSRKRKEQPATNKECQDAWLHEIAQTQARAVAEYVTSDCWIIEHDLLRDAPFIDFQIRFSSACVYDLSFAGINGAVRFVNQRLSENAFATRYLLDRLRINEIGWVTVRQPLTRDEATSILNQNNEFCFDYVRVELRASPGINEPVVVQPRGSVKSEVLYHRYPKLGIEITKSLASWLSDEREGLLSRRELYFATLQLGITNRRQSTILIETFKLVMTVEGKQYVAYAESGSHVSLMRYIAKDGSDATSGIAFPNLNASPPLKLPQDRAINGALQFIFEQIDFDKYTADVISRIGQPDQGDPLANMPFRLLLIDKNGEEHPQGGNLNFGHE